jgi:cyclopropane fatty-acyl-phospholipid synthase-like methyltransferase
LQTISEEYRAINRKLHTDNPDYGVSGHKRAQALATIARKSGIREILDYGCGKGTLKVALSHGYNVHEYDPAIDGKDAAPSPADLVYCGDVAEHIEPEYLDAFLDDLKRVTKKQLFMVIATRPAKKTLEDGRNAHLIQQPIEWWLPKLKQRFDLDMIAGNGKEFTFIGLPRED